MRLRFPRFFPVLIFTLAALHAPAAPMPQASPPDDNEMINGIKLSDAPLDSALQLLEMWTGRSILRPQALPGATYTVNISKPLPKPAAIRAIETLLELNGVGVVPFGDRFLKAVPLAQARTEAPPLITGSTLDLPPSGHIAAKVFQLHFLRVNEIFPQIQPLMTPGAASVPILFDKNNSALVIDSVTNLQRVEALLTKLDTPAMADLNPTFYQLHFAKASDLVNKLHLVFQGVLQNQLGSGTTFNADDRTNQIIVICHPLEDDLFNQIITKLDIKSDTNTRNEVISLKHATAKDVASLLSQLISGQNSAAEKSGQATPHPDQPAPKPSVKAALNSLGMSDSSTQFSNLVTVIADDRSNSIVVSGTVDDLRLIKEVVDKVDVLLAQVSIQVVIAEVTLDDSDSSGINALNLNVTSNTAGKDTTISSFSGGVAGWGVTSGIVNPLSFAAALTASGAGSLGGSSKTKVLAADTIVTTHNQEAEFVVSKQVPILSGSTSTAAATTSGFATSSTVTYQNVGIDVKVTPLIGDDGSIQLKIDQKVDDLDVSTQDVDGQPQPIIDHREATSFINVQDGQMVVLGGLQQTTTTATRSKVGFFYEIPILSNILGAHTSDQVRTELLLFVRPHVIPAANGKQETDHQIDQLSSKGDVKQFLADPGKVPKPSLLDKYYR